MIPSIIGILVIIAGLVLVYLGVYGHDRLMPIYPVGADSPDAVQVE